MTNGLNSRTGISSLIPDRDMPTPAGTVPVARPVVLAAAEVLALAAEGVDVSHLASLCRSLADLLREATA